MFLEGVMARITAAPGIQVSSQGKDSTMAVGLHPTSPEREQEGSGLLGCQHLNLTGDWIQDGTDFH